jgi:peptidyl-dipeptidase A
MPRTNLLVTSLLAAAGCAACFMSRDPAEDTLRAEAQRYLDRYGPAYQARVRAAGEARWDAQVRAPAGDPQALERERAAELELAAFTGSTENIELSRAYLRRKRELLPRQVRELEAILRLAGGAPQTARTLVAQRIAAEAEQAAVFHTAPRSLRGEPTTGARLGEILRSETELAARREAWEAALAPGRELRERLVVLRSLRNEVVRALGYADYCAYRTGEYGLSPAAMAQQMYELQRDLRPLYAELHTWARHELARRYGEPVPDLIPAHWLPDAWGRNWTALVVVAGHDLDGALRDESPLELVERADRFCQSLGFEPLSASFWERSALRSSDAAEAGVRHEGIRAWHVDLERDVRCSARLESNAAAYESAHRALGRVHFGLQVARPEVPMVLRAGASRAYPAAVGLVLGLAATQPRGAAAAGLELGADAPDPLRVLLSQALDHVVSLPWTAGVLFEWEREVYEQELPAARWQSRWWELVARYQGIAPPQARDDAWCDPAAVPSLNTEPAVSYDRALACVLAFQLHDHVSRNILREDARDTLYHGRREVGDFLRSLMRPGATVDGVELLRDRTGQSLSAGPLVDYFEPLYRWLQAENRGRAHTLLPL